MYACNSIRGGMHLQSHERLIAESARQRARQKLGVRTSHWWAPRCAATAMTAQPSLAHLSAALRASPHTASHMRDCELAARVMAAPGRAYQRPNGKGRSVKFPLRRKPNATFGITWSRGPRRSSRTLAARQAVQARVAARVQSFALPKRACEMSNLETYREKTLERVCAADEVHDSGDRVELLGLASAYRALADYVDHQHEHGTAGPKQRFAP
jgi:hypothetical protein